MKCGSKPYRITEQAIGIAALFLMISMQGCGLTQNTIPKTSATCAAGTVQIGVMEGQIKRICGCDETATTSFPNSGFTCTIRVGTVVYFQFINITNHHRMQIQNVFPPITTADIAPNGETVQVDATIRMPTAGTFTFIDQNVPSMGGTLTVN